MVIKNSNVVNNTDADAEEADGDGEPDANEGYLRRGETVYEMSVEDAPIVMDLGIEVRTIVCCK